LSHIIVADDQKINLEAVKLSLESVGIIDNVSYCADGKIALDTAISRFEEALKQYNGSPQQPISAMLLDIQMPMKSGLQVVSEVDAFCARQSGKLVKPVMIYLSSYVTEMVKTKIEK